MTKKTDRKWNQSVFTKLIFVPEADNSMNSKHNTPSLSNFTHLIFGEQSCTKVNMTE